MKCLGLRGLLLTWTGGFATNGQHNETEHSTATTQVWERFEGFISKTWRFLLSYKPACSKLLLSRVLSTVGWWKVVVYLYWVASTLFQENADMKAFQ